MSSLPRVLFSVAAFLKLIPKWDFKSCNTIISNTFFHKEVELLVSQLTGGDCFLLEMAQDSLAFGAALPAHQQGVQDMVSIEMSWLWEGGCSVTLIQKAAP